MLVNYDGKEKSTQANSQYKYTNHSNKVTLRVMYIHHTSSNSCTRIWEHNTELHDTRFG